jgi:hypothetical protein
MNDTDTTLSPIRQRVLDLAATAVGVGIQRRRTMDGVDGAVGDGYLRLIADGETVSMARAMGTMSGCGCYRG